VQQEVQRRKVSQKTRITQLKKGFRAKAFVLYVQVMASGAAAGAKGDFSVVQGAKKGRKVV